MHNISSSISLHVLSRKRHVDYRHKSVTVIVKGVLSSWHRGLLLTYNQRSTFCLRWGQLRIQPCVKVSPRVLSWHRWRRWRPQISCKVIKTLWIFPVLAKHPNKVMAKSETLESQTQAGSVTIALHFQQVALLNLLSNVQLNVCPCQQSILKDVNNA